MVEVADSISNTLLGKLFTNEMLNGTRILLKIKKMKKGMYYVGLEMTVLVGIGDAEGSAWLEKEKMVVTFGTNM